MKIIYKKGDLFDAPEKVILHGCNAQGVMGAGVALGVRTRYPDAFREYEKHTDFCKKNKIPTRELVGNVVWAICPGKIVLNAISQNFYGRDPNTVYVSYLGVENIFKQTDSYFKWFAESGKVPEDVAGVLGEVINLPYPIAMPRIGAGLANGDWKRISHIVEEQCTAIQPIVYDK
jgi:O-acetyl-ADP-ribose deacetylase (regulator of RNase III)